VNAEKHENLTITFTSFTKLWITNFTI